MKIGAIVFLLFAVLASITAAPSPPREYQALLDAGFNVKKFKLKDDEKELFFKAYKPDLEIQERMAIDACIVGEAPTINEAIKKFPRQYPPLGRMKGIKGTLQWEEIDGKKTLMFITEKQRYRIKEYFLLHRLEQMGFTEKSAATHATIDACWAVYELHGLILIYMETILLP